ncbi:MAG: LptF/LptG family permease [Epsilonproteobacteria bacterium]|nr:LptF/LptG family permease [Campylobacterota bacterium]
MANGINPKLSRVSLSSYISQNFTKAFLTIFLPLFFIGALVFIIRLSSLTSQFQVSFTEMAELFSYNIPLILFYTLPISFLVAIAITLLRLSTENELMALIALGVQARKLTQHLWIIAFLFSLLLLALSLIQIPQAKQQFSSFKARKATEAQLNVNPSQLGQKFGDFFIYIKEKKDDSMKDVIIYKKGDEQLSNQLFIAKEAKIINQDASIELTLNQGHGYTFEERSLKEIKYEDMQITKSLNSEGYNYKSIVEHWIKYSFNPKKKREILFFIFISLIPIIGLYIIASFSIINPRYQKNYAYHILGVTIVALYVIATSLKNQGSFLTLSLALIGTYIIGHALFHYKVTRYF